MKRAIVIIGAVIGLIVLGLGIHWAVWELVPPVAGKDLVDSGTFKEIDGMQIRTRARGVGPGDYPDSRLYQQPLYLAVQHPRDGGKGPFCLGA